VFLSIRINSSYTSLELLQRDAEVHSMTSERIKATSLDRSYCFAFFPPKNPESEYNEPFS